jgi:uncharacterized protein (TIGR03067 family)
MLGVVLAVGAPGEKDKKEGPSIVGEWDGVKAVRGGQERPNPEGGVVVTFSADGKITIVEGGKPKDEQGSYKVDTKKNPAEIDVTAPKEEGTYPGIFKIEGDTLTVCLGDKGSTERPTKFESPDGSKILLLTFKRAKK